MFVFKVTLFAVLACAHAQNFNAPTTTPVPILKQINRQNDDGSYSYGYEAADGSFKIETKYASGDVAGKYGYVGEDGKLKEISYGASSKRGFEPQGSGIMVPPPTLNDNPSNALTDGQEDDGQYREDPKIYEDPKYNRASRPSTFKQFHRPAQAAEPEYQQPQYQQPQYQQPQYQQPQYQQQQYQPSQFRSTPSYSQQSSLFNQGDFTQNGAFPQQNTALPQQNTFPQQPQNIYNQAPQQFAQSTRPQSQIYHQQPQFSYQAYTPQNNQYQTYNPYQNSNFNPFNGHPAQNFDPSTGSYTINFTG